MKEQFNLLASGKIKASIINDGIAKEVLTRSNEILPGALEILTRRLVNIESSLLDSIKAYNGATLLAQAEFSQQYNNIDITAEFQGLFNEASFDGTITRLVLCTDAGELEFSEADGLSLAKDDTEQLLITWTIKLQ